MQFNNTGSPQTVFTACLPGFYVVDADSSGFASLYTDARPSIQVVDNGPARAGVTWMDSGDSLLLATSSSGSYTVDVRFDRFAGGVS